MPESFPRLSTYLPYELAAGLPGLADGWRRPAYSDALPFASLLARALQAIALDNRLAAALPVPGQAESPFRQAAAPEADGPPPPADARLGQTYAPGVATRAYWSDAGWNFVPVYIPPTPIAAGAEGAARTAESAAPVAVSSPPVPVSDPQPSTAGPLALTDFPRPAADNGRGMHWIPTVASSPEVVDRFVEAITDMRVKWVVFLNDGTDTTRNDYLVERLVANGIQPIMRVQTSGLQPISGDLAALVRRYTAKGVYYYQLYNEPNHPIENDGRPPDVNRYLDLWLPAARVVAENGGLPGLGALSPGGPVDDGLGGMRRVDDRAFLLQALRAIKARGEVSALDRAWLAAHNYMGERPLSDPDGLLRVRQYDAIARQELGRSLPVIGTEGGSYVIGPVSEAARTQRVTEAMRYMQNAREPYNFAYTYWIIANSLGGGGDPSFEWQALFQPGYTSPVVEALRNL